MRANSRGLFAAMFIAVYLANVLGADEPDPIVFDGLMSVSKTSSGDMSAMHGGILFQGGRPEACFDLIRNQGQRPELIYLVLFQSERLPKQLKLSLECASNGERAHGRYSLDLAGKPLKIRYDFEIDSKAGAARAKSIDLNGTEWKADGPRVFLADISGEELKLKPVEVRLPDELPSPDEEDLKGRIRRVIDVLKRDNDEVRKFLAPEKTER